MYESDGMPQMGLHARTHMMLSRLHGNREIGTVLVCAYPCSIQSYLGLQDKVIHALFLMK